MPELMGEDRSSPSGSASRTGWRTKILTGMITLAGIGGLVMMVLYSYEKSDLTGTSSVIPIISARDGPTKIRPEKPGGMVIHHQDKNVYNRIDPSTKRLRVEKLLPSPDPVILKPGSPKIKKNKELTVPKSVSKKESFTNKSSLRDGSYKEKLVERKNIKISPKPLVPNINSSVQSGYRVQFASLRNESEAAAFWKKLKDKFPVLLANLKPRIERTVIKGKGTYYRLRTGEFKNSGSARALCNKAKKRNIGCFIVTFP